MQNKLLSILGFVQKSGNLYTGENTCELYIKKRAIRLLIISNDASENTIIKFINLCNSKGVPYIVYGNRETLSKAIGKCNRTVFGVKDKNFANKILEIYNSLNLDLSR
ncbi:MAG: hypothetical protein PWQ37_166 [Candidatus Petromonas sp.]|jgi:ribosomal protein L7Ae-like RNA K-turn-binding protein|nr:hypothetical protein [Candidatus Petromonas sp.]